MTTLIPSHNWNVTYWKSQAEYEFLIALNTPTNYFNIFIQHRQKTMTYEETADFMLKWTLEQNIDLRTFILQVYMILRKYHLKKNTLYLQGASNAGKTYMLEWLVPHKDKVGNHIMSRDFMFQECLTKPIILINKLTLQNQAKSEIYKNTLGGEPTYVNVKNNRAELMYRKPVLLTSNLPIWRFVTNDKDALLNMDLGPSLAIKSFTTKGVPSTSFWKKGFANIDDVQTYFCIPQNETFLDHTEIFRSSLSEDCQSITSPDINNCEMLPPSPKLSPIKWIPSPTPYAGPSHQISITTDNSQESTNSPSAVQQTTPTDLEVSKINKSSQINKSILSYLAYKVKTLEFSKCHE